MKSTSLPNPGTARLIDDFLDENGVLNLHDVSSRNGLTYDYEALQLSSNAIRTMRHCLLGCGAVLHVLVAEEGGVFELGDYVRNGLLIGLDSMLGSMEDEIDKAEACRRAAHK